MRKVSSILCGFYEGPIRNGLALNQVFNAVPSPPFSAVAELASLKHPRRPVRPGSLEGQRRSEAASLGNPRGYALLVAGHLKVPEKGRQGAKRNRSDRWKGECRIPPPRYEGKAKPSMVVAAIPNWCFEKGL